MPPKKPPLPAAINIRLKRDEAAAVIADVQAIKSAASIPLIVSGYAKHALLSYGKLRRMEGELRSLRDEFQKFEPNEAKNDHGRIVLNRLNFILGLEAS